MADSPYLQGMEILVTSGLTGWQTGQTQLAVLLVSSSYTFDGTHSHVSSVSAHELTSTAYTLNNQNGRSVLLNVSSAQNAALGIIPMTASSVDWLNMSSTDSIGAAITFLSATTDDTTNPLMFHHGSVSGSPTGSLTANWNATSGMAYLASGT